MMKFVLKRLGLAAAAALLAAGPALAQRTQLNVYTAVETDQMKTYKEAFEKAYPDIEIVWNRDSTGVITAKLLAEKAKPRADVVFALAATSLLVLDQDGMLVGYAPQGVDAVAAPYKDARNPPHWVGLDLYGAAVCFNTVEAQKQGLPKPESWKDLAKPVYRGKIVMPHPASSGTGYLDVAAWLQIFGESDGWRYMDALHENIAEYQHSGSKPCRSAGTGEYPIGISFEYRANVTKASGAPIDIVFPKEGLGWEIEASGIVKGTQKMDAARKLMDWAVTREAMELYARSYAVVAVPGVAKPLPNIPPDYEKLLIKSDLGWVAKNRERILAEWTKRYSTKAAAK